MPGTGVHEDPRWPIEMAAAVAAQRIAVAEAVHADCRRGCPVDTGELLESIHALHEVDDSFIFVGTDHWAPTEYGSSPHLIVAHGPYSLHNRETGQYFGRVVLHPGTPEQPFMRSALYRQRALGTIT